MRTFLASKSRNSRSAIRFFCCDSKLFKIGGKKCGSLPLHIASRNGCDAEILKMLFEAYPRALETKNSSGETPYDAGAGHVSASLSLSILLHHFLVEFETNKNVGIVVCC